MDRPKRVLRRPLTSRLENSACSGMQSFLVTSDYCRDRDTTLCQERPLIEKSLSSP